jgi:ribosomal protein L37AE/L43A
LLTSPTTPEEQYVSNILRKEYEDVSIDHGLHPDDDFEEIIDRVLDRLAQDYGHNVTEADSPYFAETTVAGSVAPVAHEMAEESEKNPFTNALGHALWRDLSKEKKASPQQVQRNKERWAKRQAEREQGVAEEAENKDMTGQTCEKCKRGKYQETSIHDDMDGVLHCTKCGTKVDRWRAYKEPSARARSRQATKDFNRSKSQGMAEGSTDTVYPNAEVIKSKNGKPIGEIYKDEYGWGCFHYGADRGYDLIDSRKDAIDALRDLHQEAGHKGPDYTIKGVAEGYDDEEHPIRDDGNEGRPGKQYQCPRCHSTDIKTYSDGEKECHQCHKTWDVKGVAETTRGGFGGSAGQAHHEIEWLKNKIETLKPLLAKKPSIARQIKDLERQIRERELAIAYQKEGMAEGEQQAFVNPHHNDPINANSAITGSYYEGEDPLVRLKSLALSK